MPHVGYQAGSMFHSMPARIGSAPLANLAENTPLNNRNGTDVI